MGAVEYVWGKTHYAQRKVRDAVHDRGCRQGQRREPTCGGAFRCGTCGKLVGWCKGAFDEHPDDCDPCANKKADEKEASR